MFNVKELAERIGLTEWQTRKLIYACRPLLNGEQGWLGYGQNGELQISSQALAILERAKDLRLAGKPRKEIGKLLAAELGKPLSDETGKPRQESASRPANPDYRDELIKEMRSRIESLERDKSYLQAKLDEALGKIPALPSAPKHEGSQLSRWRALRYALLGR